MPDLTPGQRLLRRALGVPWSAGISVFVALALLGAGGAWWKGPIIFAILVTLLIFAETAITTAIWSRFGPQDDPVIIATKTVQRYLVTAEATITFRSDSLQWRGPHDSHDWAIGQMMDSVRLINKEGVDEWSTAIKIFANYKTAKVEVIDDEEEVHA
jgi:hypothetical protein